MNKNLVKAFALVFAVSCRADPCSEDAQLAAYRQIVSLDQQPRLRFMDWRTKHNDDTAKQGLSEIIKDMQQSDIKVKGLLMAAWDSCGPPKDSSLSREKVDAVVLVALHGHLEIQMKVIEFLRAAADKGLVAPKLMETIEERLKKSRQREH